MPRKSKKSKKSKKKPAKKPAKPNKGGRPQEYTDAQIIAALKATKGMVFLAARRLGCNTDTIFNRMKTSSSVAACRKQADGVVDDAAESQLYKSILAGEPWAVMFRLRTKGKDRGYTEKTEVEHSGKIGMAFEDMTDEELAAELERLERLEQTPKPG